MKLYGLDKNNIDLIKSILEKYLADKKNAIVYLFGSRSTGKQKEYSDIDLALKLPGAETKKIIAQIQSNLEDSDLPYKVDFLNWDEIAKEYLPSIREQKIPFWTPAESELKSPWRICPIGKHWTRTHIRNLKSGQIVTQSGHCKTNPSQKDLLKGEEIELIPKLNIFKKSIFPTNDALDFPMGSAYDELIAGWTAYWNSIFTPTIPLDPNIVKVLVATESSFKDNVITTNKSKKTGNAHGLIQITDATFKTLKNSKGELKDHLVILKKEELLDANKNLAAGIRWLFRKKETAKQRLKREPTWEEVLWEYKGITLDRSKTALEIKKNIKDFLQRLNHPQH